MFIRIILNSLNNIIHVIEEYENREKLAIVGSTFYMYSLFLNARQNDFTCVLYESIEPFFAFVGYVALCAICHFVYLE